MGNVNTTPWMNLPNPVPSTDPGPDYATNLQSCINGIDQHNHSPGSGQQITPNGLSINTDLTFGGNSATHLKASIYSAQSSFASLLSAYVIGNDLYYNDGAGNVIQLTSGGLVNATSSGISSGTASAAFATGVLVVKSSSTSGANILMQSAVLTNAGNLTNQLTLAAPVLSGSITETLPTIPLSGTAFVTMDTSGNMATSVALLGALTSNNLSPTAGITGTQLSASANIAGSQLSASANILKSQLAALGLQTSSSVSPSTSSGSLSDATGLTVTITTTGRPVFVGLTTGYYNMVSTGNSASPGTVLATIAIVRGSTTINAPIIEVSADAASGGRIQSAAPAGSVMTIDPIGAGTYTYKIQFAVSQLSGGGSPSLFLNNATLAAYEL